MSWGLLSLAHANSSNLGFIDTIQSLFEINKENNKNLSKVITNEQSIFKDFSNVEKIEIHQDFLTTIIFHSQRKYLSLAKDQSCSFLSLLENGLLKSNEGNIETVLVNIFQKDKEIETAFIPLNDYIEFKSKTECPNNPDIKKIFSPENVKKTLNSIDFPNPKSTIECNTVLENWKKNVYTTYLCGIHETIKRGDESNEKSTKNPGMNYDALKKLRDLTILGEKYKENISFIEQKYLSSLCSNLSNSNKFCSTFVSDNYWEKLLSLEVNIEPLSIRCSLIKRKKNPTKADLKECASLLSLSETCKNIAIDFPSLFPTPNCSQISTAVENGNLINNYADCPASVANHGITNTLRIFNHFKKNKLTTDPISCFTQAGQQFAELNLQNENEEAWSYKQCYFDKVQNAETCIPTLLHNANNSKYSIEDVIAKILMRRLSTPNNLKCKFIPEPTYDPRLLEYKHGCFILFTKENCKTTSCPYKIIYGQKEIDFIKLNGSTIFDYFPTKLNTQKYSMMNILEEQLKIEYKEIRNLTELRYFFKQNKNGIVHGIGCLEDILPQFYKKTTLNQCQPMPFIIDGHIENEESSLLIIRTAIDNTQAPRLIEWNQIYSAVKTYFDFQPIEHWPLYGIK